MAFKINIACPKHPRYNPVEGGLDTIKGGCTLCLEIYRLYTEYIATLNRVNFQKRKDN